MPSLSNSLIPLLASHDERSLPCRDVRNLDMFAISTRFDTET